MPAWDDLEQIDSETIIPWKLWWSSLRPKTLLASMGPVVLGLALAYRHHHHLHFEWAILTMLCTLLMQIGTNLVNDYYDGIRGIDGPNRQGPKRLVASAQVSPEKMRRAWSLVFLLALLVGLLLIARAGTGIALTGFVCLAVAYLYTGGPWPLSYYALGELLALIFFGPVAVAGTFYLQTLTLKDSLPLLIVAGLAPGCISACILSINNLRDRQSDSQTKKMTLAIILGERLARGLVIFLGLIPLFVPWMLPSLMPWDMHPAFFLLAFFPLVYYKAAKEILAGASATRLNQLLAMCGQYLLFYCLLLSLGIVWG